MIAAARMIERLLLHPAVRETYGEAFLLPPALGVEPVQSTVDRKLDGSGRSQPRIAAATTAIDDRRLHAQPLARGATSAGSAALAGCRRPDGACGRNVQDGYREEDSTPWSTVIVGSWAWKA